MIYIVLLITVLLITVLLIISFAIFFVIEMYCKIFKKESRAFLGIVICLTSLLLIDKVRNHLIKNKLVENLRTSEIESGHRFFSKNELSDVHPASERVRTLDQNIYVVLMPQKDTLYMHQDFHEKNKFWVHYEKYEILGITAPIGYIVKN